MMMELWFIFILLPVTFLLYWLCKNNQKIQNIILLISSFIVYYLLDAKYLLVLVLCIGLTYGGGLLGHKLKNDKVYNLFILLNILVLVFFKYIHLLEFGKNILLPVGISFYVFQSTSYLFDLKRGDVELEESIFDYGLFVSFFPTIVSGPIQKSKEFLPKIKKEKSISFLDIQDAVYIYLWGLFLKMVVADRIALFTGEVFSNPSSYFGLVVIVAIVLYSFEIYTDFLGYSYMAIAIAKLFGYELTENFHQPYFAQTIVSFWRRWHISLTSWLRDYVYIPLGGNRKGKIRQYVNILIVFIISGIWHGSSNHYVVWGLIHGLGQIASYLLNIKESNKLLGGIIQRLCVFIYVGLGWVFFRSYSVSSAITLLGNIMGRSESSLLEFMPMIEWVIIICGLLLLLIVSFYRESGVSVRFTSNNQLVFKYMTILVLIFVVIIFGIYGPNFEASSFIYEGF